jgi:hypothetical protein
MREHQLSLFSKLGVVVLVALAFAAALVRIADGVVGNPRAFLIVLAGLCVFLIGKGSVIAGGQWISFGSRHMSENMANLYRLGYWLMAVGILLTFA